MIINFPARWKENLKIIVWIAETGPVQNDFQLETVCFLICEEVFQVYWDLDTGIKRSCIYTQLAQYETISNV